MNYKLVLVPHRDRIFSCDKIQQDYISAIEKETLTYDNF